MKRKIGYNAGSIWSYLDEVGEKNLKDIKKACKLSEKELYAAIGWLAREEKIELKEQDDDLSAALL